MAISTTIGYDDPNNFTYDSDIIEVTGSVARLKSIPLQGDETFVAKLTDSKDADRAAGSVTGTLNGSAAIESGFLNLDQGASSSIDYASASNFSPSNKFALRMKVKAGFTGAPSANQRFIDISNESNTNDFIFLEYSTSQNWVINIRDSTGSNIVNVSEADGGRFSSGTTYEIELNVNLTDGATKLYIDGAEVVSNTDTGTYSGSSLTNIRIGNTSLFSPTSAEFQVKDFQIFDAPQHTSSFTGEVPRVVPIYITDDPIIINAGLDADSLNSFSEVATTPSGSDVQYTLNIDGQDKYWDGSAWSNSDGTFAQSSSAATINTNASDLDISSGADLKVKAFLSSDDGTVRPELESVTYEYSFYKSQTALNTCVVYSYITLNTGPISGATIRFYTESSFFSNSNYINIEKTVSSRSDGYFEATLPSSSDNIIKVKIKYSDNKTGVVERNLDIKIPNQTSASLEDIVVA